MTPKERIGQHDKEIAEIRGLQLQSEQHLTRLEQSMIALVNQQAEMARAQAELAKTVERFIRSLPGGNGHRKGK